MRLSYYCRTIPTMILLICASDNAVNDSVITFVKTNNVQDLASRTYITSHKSIPPRDIIPSSPSAELIKDASDNLSKEDSESEQYYQKQMYDHLYKIYSPEKRRNSIHYNNVLPKN